MLFSLKFHQNATKFPSKYYKNSIRIPILSAKKWVVLHRNNSGKHAVNLDKISGSIPMVFQWNSVKIPLWFQMFTSGMPAEFLQNTALKFQHFFRGHVFSSRKHKVHAKLLKLCHLRKFNDKKYAKTCIREKRCMRKLI